MGGSLGDSAGVESLDEVDAKDGESSEDDFQVREVKKLPDKASQLIGDVRVRGEEASDVLIIEEEDSGGPAQAAKPVVFVGKEGEVDSSLVQILSEQTVVVPSLMFKLRSHQL